MYHSTSHLTDVNNVLDLSHFSSSLANFKLGKLSEDRLAFTRPAREIILQIILLALYMKTKK